ncbi:OPT oligopeptide transporter protein-domain-containing protein [Umbelopsis sp. AD052]|nr:OPT oligopeptide transporter protein-domain-containing protein [Umbelopsis sp. AD052]
MAAIGERNEYDHEVHRANSSEYHPKGDYNEKGGEYYNEGDVEYNNEHVDSEEEENSPIEEVAAVVPATDDPSIPVYTFRVFSLGIIFTALLAFVNQFFWFRAMALQLSPLVVQLLSFPLAKLMEVIIPRSKFFNPGAFSMKEHVLITVMANCSYQTAYAIDIITVQRIWYKQDLGWGGGFLLVMTTQLIGYGMAGVLRPYLVYPSSMVFPANLVNISLFRSLHVKDLNWTGPSRIKWFLMVFTCMFVYYWLPGFLFPVLTYFSWACWINPNNRTLSQLTGGYSGLGMLALSFDWATITSYLSSPLIVPYWATANITVGFVLFAWFIVPVLYYTNVWDSQSYPIVSEKLFTVDGSRYNVSMVLNPDVTVNETLYEEYGPVRLTALFAFSYGIMFAGLTSVLTHTVLYHGKDIVRQFKRSRSEDEDIHMKLMRAYPEVPSWWYYGIFLAAFGVSFGVIYGWPIHLPWWGLILSIALAAIFILPIGIISAITNQTPGLNVITEFIIGFALPGHPIANVTFKTYGYISMVQGLTFVSDLKLGHYTKIPPKAMFIVQIIGTVVGGFVNLATARWLMDTIPNICTKAAFPFVCNSASTFYSASVIWGAIGPAKMFAGNSPYSSMLYFFLIGLVLPIPFFLYSRKYPNSWVKYVHIPLIFNATGMMPPAVPLNFSMWCACGFVFMYWIRKYRHEWWTKYNYVTSAALDSGVAIAGIVIFGVQMGTANSDQPYGWSPTWWGNDPDYVDHCPLAGLNMTNTP